MRTPYFFFLAVAVALPVVTGCTEPNPAFNPDPILPGECRAGGSFTETLESFERPDQLDILLIVDNSGDVEDLQASLAESLPDFLARIENAGIHTQIGTATTDGTGEIALAPAGTSGEGCDANTTVVPDSGQGNWKSIAACNARTGASGDAFQQSLEVARTLTVGKPAAFLRPSARKLILIVTNEDDCSASEEFDAGGDPAREVCARRSGDLVDVEAVVSDLKSIATTPEGVALAVVSGPPDDGSEEVRPVCSSSLGSVFPADRLFEATSSMGDAGSFQNLCASGLRAPLMQIADSVAVAEHTTICPSAPLLHEPLAVDGISDEEEETIRFGEAGFIFLGETETCSNGALRFSAEALGDVDSVQVEYCTE